MVKAAFKAEGNRGLLSIVTHFGKCIDMPCVKQDDEVFRLGGTAVNEVMCYEGVILRLPKNTTDTSFRAFITPERVFESKGILSNEDWSEGDLHCYVTEHYTLGMEGKPPTWFISHEPIREAHRLFINLDVLDGAGNLLKRYRVSPFTGDNRVIHADN